MFTRMAAVLAALACLSAGVVAAGADGPAAAGTSVTYDELPVGAPTTLPWWQHDQLHVGDAVIDTRRKAITSRSGTTVVATGEGRRLGGPATWFLVDGDRLRQLPMRTEADRPLISANGRWIAWSEVRARNTDAYKRIERFRVVVYNVSHQRIANVFRDRRLVEWEDGINAIWLHTLSNSGRLVLSRGSDGVQVLSPSTGPVPFGGPQVGNGADVDGWPRGTTVVRSRSGTSVYGTVGSDGAFVEAGRFTDSWVGLWSADGTTYAFTDYDSAQPTHWVRTLEGTTTQLGTPTDVREFGIAGWESPDALVLWEHDTYSGEPVTRLVRCFASTGGCEQVPDGPVAGAFATMPVD